MVSSTSLLATSKDVERLRTGLSVFKNSSLPPEVRALIDFFSDKDNGTFFILVYYCHCCGMSIENFFQSLLKGELNQPETVGLGRRGVCLPSTEEGYQVFYGLVREVFSVVDVVLVRRCAYASNGYLLPKIMEEYEKCLGLSRAFLLTPLTMSSQPEEDLFLACMANVMCAMEEGLIGKK